MRKERDRLVLENLRLVHYFVIKFGVNYNSSDYDDFISIGTIGLIKAAENFNESKGIKFGTYASRCIQNEILMHYRRVKKCSNEISLDSIIFNDKDGSEIKITDTISSDEKSFIEQMENKEILERYMNLVLNSLKPRDRLIMLYNIAEISQRCIAEKFNLSQSYISRIIEKLNMKVKSYINSQKQFKEVFSMTVSDNSYKINFSSKDVREFNKIFAAFLASIVDPSTLPDFKVSCNKERVMLQIPANHENFSFIAQIIRQIDDFSMTFVSGKDTSEVNTIEQSRESSIKKIAESEIEQDVTDLANKGVSLIEQDSSDVEKKSKVKKIRDYMLSLEAFTTKDLKQQFPDLKDSKDSTIRNAIYLAKSKGLIKSAGKGKYVVNRN